MKFLSSTPIPKLLLASAIASFVPGAGAATISEYFNGYGPDTTAMVDGTLNGGSGWSGPWQSAAGNSYIPGSVAPYSGSGYSSTGNGTASGDGVAAGIGTATVAYRTFSTTLTGTIWISATIHQASLSRDTLMWLDMSGADIGGGNREFIALRGSTGTAGTAGIPEPVISYNGADDTSNETDFAILTTHLLLARIDMNVDGGVNDSISFWVDPDLTGGIAGLGTAAYYKSGADAYGVAFDGIGISGNNAGSTIDAIRISNEADGFDFVTTGVPEASGSLLLLASGLLLCGRRSRR